MDDKNQLGRVDSSRVHTFGSFGARAFGGLGDPADGSALSAIVHGWIPVDGVEKCNLEVRAWVGPTGKRKEPGQAPVNRFVLHEQVVRYPKHLGVCKH